jgi:hypothetical protein
MPRNPMLKTPQFSIRTMMVVTTLVAVCLVGWRERTRYLREHLFVSVVDQVTGSLLPRFQYQTSVITSETGEEGIWSQWQEHSGPNALTLKVPQYCRLEFRARALDVAGGYRQQEQSILVLPHLSHNATLRLTEGKGFQSFLIDSTTGEPICGARIVSANAQEDDTSPCFFESQPYFDAEFETFSDSNGRFVVRNLDTVFAIDAPKHQSKIVRFAGVSGDDLTLLRNNGIKLEPAIRIHGRVTCRETGKPISNCKVLYDKKLYRSKGKFQPFSANEWNKFNLVAQTDEMGGFEFFADSDTEDCQVWFSKDGWSKESVGLNSCDENISLEPWPFELVGTVVDESGEPVQEFEIKTYSNWIDVETHSFLCEKGSFRITDDKSIVSFEVHAKDKGIFSKQIQSNWAETPLSEHVIMPNGFDIAGSVLGKAVISNGARSEVRIELTRLTSKYDKYEVQYAGRASVADTTVDQNGSFRFSHIANGTYLLVTSYFGHVINTRPVVVNNSNVLVSPIELPPLGKIRGKVRKQDGSDAPFHRTYLTDQEGNPQKWFHTNHLGEFEIENVPCGRYGIGPQPKQRMFVGCGFGGRAWDVDGALLVEPALTTEFKYDRFPLFEIHGLRPEAILWSNVSVSKQFSAIDFAEFEFAKLADSSQENLSTAQMVSQTQARDHQAFVLSLIQDACEQEITLVYRANRNGNANKILFRPRQLKLTCSDVHVPIEKAKPEVEITTPSDDPFKEAPLGEDTSSKSSAPQSELYVGKTSIFLLLLQQNRVLSVIQSTGLQEIVPFHVHDDEPDAAIIHNTRFGWTRIHFKQPFDRATNVHELKLEKGAEILGRINLADLPLMPETVRLVDEQGVTLTCDVEDDSKFSFQKIWPGKWRAQLLGFDPYLGERILAQRELVIEGVDSLDLELGAPQASQNN